MVDISATTKLSGIVHELLQGDSPSIPSLLLECYKVLTHVYN
jgi:hypothetical protein